MVLFGSEYLGSKDTLHCPVLGSPTFPAEGHHNPNVFETLSVIGRIGIRQPSHSLSVFLSLLDRSTAYLSSYGMPHSLSNETHESPHPSNGPRHRSLWTPSSVGPDTEGTPPPPWGVGLGPWPRRGAGGSPAVAHRRGGRRFRRSRPPAAGGGYVLVHNGVTQWGTQWVSAGKSSRLHVPCDRWSAG